MIGLNAICFSAGGGTWLTKYLSGAIDPDSDDFLYESAQAVVGGSLVAYSGPKAKTQLGKFFTEGAKATATDFAFSSKDDFTGREAWQHAGIFAGGGLQGMYQGFALNKKNFIYTGLGFAVDEGKSVGFGLNLIGFGAEFVSQGFIKAAQKEGTVFYTGGWQNKTGVGLLKSYQYNYFK